MWCSGLKDLVLPQLWCKLPTAQIQSLALELPYAMGVELKERHSLVGYHFESRDQIPDKMGVASVGVAGRMKWG